MTRLFTLRTASLLLTAVALSACPSPTPDPGDAITVTITPPTAQVQAGSSFSFRADVAGTSDARVTWSVKEGGGGTVNQTGTYTAPAITGVYTVQASSVADPTKTASASVTVTAAASNVQVSITPESAAVEAGKTVQFAAGVTGANNTSVTWSVEEGNDGGSITADGLYTAPATAGTYHVLAVSVADPAKKARATLTVTVPPQVQVAITPTTASLVVGQTQQFLASVAGTSNTAVTWSIQEGAAGGAVDASGVYTAPQTPGTFHVVATSAADTSKTAVATVTITLPNVVVAVAPSSVALLAGQTQQFSASVSGSSNTAVTWSVQQGAAGGTIDAGGLYTAPAAAGTYHVVATSAANPSATATATITVTLPPVAISLTPSAASLSVQQTQQFTASVTGTSNTAVTWSVQEGGAGGTVSSGGLYTAPAIPGTFHVVATSVADPTKSATATITVLQPVAVTINPTSASLLVGGTQQFTAGVTGSTNTAVTWSVQQGAAGGTVNASGLYTAPSTAGTYQVVATSVADPTKSATATVTVAPLPVTISVSPNNASVVAGGTQQFTATVTGSTNTAVTWSIQEGAAGGSVSASGLYSAPAATGTYHVVATSAADPSKTAIATVAVTAAPVVAVSINPQSAALNAGGTRQFTATVTGSSNTAVTWSVQEGPVGGSVTSGGLYTTGSAAGVFHVVATSVADPSKSAVAEVTVTVPPPVAVSISPQTVSLNAGATQQFTATVTGTTNTAVAWSIQEGAVGGGISATGLYTAPGSAGTFHVVATSLADSTKSATATITVSVPVVSVAVSPANATVQAGNSFQFTATVTGTSNTAVTWSVLQGAAGGTVNASGLYTAPATAGSYQVVATSVADPSKSASATVTVTAPPVVAVSLNPTSATLRAGGTQQFMATVTGTTNTAVTWSIQQGAAGGTVSASGLYTAPAALGAYDVIATSVADPTKSATARVNVVPTTFTISGTVSNPTAKAGRVYVFLYGGNNVGTSLPIAANGTVSYSLRGAQGTGQMPVYAYLDVLGTGSWNDASSPWGAVNVTLSGANVSAGAITLTDTPAATPPAPTRPPQVVAGDGAAFVYFSRVYDTTQNTEAASHYRVYYSTTPNPGPANNLGSTLVRSGSNVLVRGLTNGVSYYFSYAAVNQGLVGPVSPSSPLALVQAPTGGLSASGMVTWTGFASTGPLYVMAIGSTGGTALTRIATPASPQSFTLPAMPTGQVYLYAFLDQGNDGEIAAVDPFRSTEVTVGSTNLTGLAISLGDGGAGASLSSSHGRWSAGERYSLNFSTSAVSKLPVKVVLTGGPMVLSPIDLSAHYGYSGYFRGSLGLELLQPRVGDTYTYDVTYSDGTTATLSATVSYVYTSTPTNLAPNSTASTTPTFSWSPPAGMPASTTFEVYVYNSSNQAIWYITGLPSATTSVVYNSDSTATAALTAGSTYSWYLQAVDADGNVGWGYSAFTAQ